MKTVIKYLGPTIFCCYTCSLCAILIKKKKKSGRAPRSWVYKHFKQIINQEYKSGNQSPEKGVHAINVPDIRMKLDLKRRGPLNEPPHDKTKKMTHAPSEDSDQPGNPPSLIRVFTVRMKNHWDLSYPESAQQRP